MIHGLKSFKTVIIDPQHKITAERLNRDIIGFVNTTYRRYRDDRRTMENHWTVNWASYLNTPESNSFMRSQILREVGNVKADWRHRINTGKTFEVIETIVGYLIQAIFPNRNWFECDPVREEYAQLAKVVRNYLRIKMQDWHFRSEATAWIRQLCICGNSVMMMPWGDDRRIEYETLDMYDCFYNPNESHARRSPFIRRVSMTRADVIERINSGFYSKYVSSLDVMSLMPMLVGGSVTHEIDFDITGERIQEFQGVNISPCSTTDRVYALEFWGDVHLPYITIKDCVITTLHGHLLRFVPNNFKCGRPFVISSYIPIVRQSHGMSPMQAASGLTHQLNTVLNQMLDGIELAVNPCYTVTPDSTLNPNDITIEPGKMIPVAQHDSIRPMEPPKNNFNLGFAEMNTIEQFINQVTGTGPLIGTAQPRGGERVTAEEIKQVVEAGGSRLLLAYTHISDTGIIEILQKSFELVQQFTKVDEQVLMDVGGGVRGFVDVGKRELEGQYRLYPKGAEHVIERTDLVNRLLSIIDLANKLPENVQTMINFEQLFMDVVRNTLYEDPERYIISTQETTEPQPATATAENVLQNNLLVDGGASLMSQALGLDANDPAVQSVLSAGSSSAAAAQLPAASTGSAGGLPAANLPAAAAAIPPI